MAAKSKKQLTFDLNTNKMKEDGLNPSVLYNDVRVKLAKLDFSHSGGSVYISDTTLTKMELEEKVKALINKIPLLSYYVNNFTVTNIGRQFELSDSIKQMNKDISKEVLLNKKNKRKPRQEKDNYEIEY
jgi:virulence-associated protein VapD